LACCRYDRNGKPLEAAAGKLSESKKVKLILSQNKTNYGTRQGDFLGLEKLILSHEEMKYVTEQGHFWGQEKLTYGHDKTNFGTE
jgi:hypothetical protein